MPSHESGGEQKSRPKAVEITTVHQRSFQQIREGALPFSITYEDQETGITLTAEGATEQEVREKLAQKKRSAIN